MRTANPIRCRIARNEGGEATRLDIYEDIGDYGWFGGLSPQDFAAQMAAVKGDVIAHINSGGGDVFDGIAIANTLRAHKGKVTTVVDGLAASIASVIAQAGQERIVQPGAMIMIHEAFGGAMGDAAYMAKFAETLDEISANIADIYASRGGGTPDEWRAAMREETWYTAAKAVTAGLADRVGDGQAELPAGLDVGNYAFPEQIAASLRRLPSAKAPGHPAAAVHPHDGEHSHSHPAYGAADADDDARHTHQHSHSGDGNHGHPHDSAPADHAHGLRGHGSAPEQTCADLGHQCCRDAAAAKDLLRGLVDDAMASWQPPAAASGEMHGDHERWDPDGDGDCDACPEGDDDNDYWAPDGSQLQPVPGKPMDDRLTRAEVKAIVAEMLAAFSDADGDFDESAWDASRAWHAGAESDDPAAFYAGICAGKKDGDKSTQDAWALPYKYSPSSKPNAAGVKAALGRLPQTEGLTNADEAKSLLQGLMKKINPDYEPEDRAPVRVNVAKLADQLGTALKGASE